MTSPVPEPSFDIRLRVSCEAASAEELRDSSFPPGSLPPVLCLCPTYGRFSLLRLALACFLEQDYPGPKHLLILNDAPEGVFFGDDSPWGMHRQWDDWVCTVEGHDQSVTVLNCKRPFENLGRKRQALLDAAWTPLVAHWDDDDLYLPHHLSRCVGALLAAHGGAEGGGGRAAPGCVKSRGAWFMVGPGSIKHDSDGRRLPPEPRELNVRGIRHNTFEGSMLFRREEALALAGYPPKHSGQALALLRKFHRLGTLYKIPDAEEIIVGARHAVPAFPSYVYRWGHGGVGHISSFGNSPRALAGFQRTNTDFGDGEPLTPGDLTPYWDAHRRYIDERLAEKQVDRQSAIGNRK